MGLNVLGICGGNGTILYPFRNGHLTGNIEPRSVFHTPNDVQWKLNFKEAYDKDEKVEYSRHSVDYIVGAPDCGHSSVMSYSRAKTLGDPQKNDSLNFFINSIHRYKPKIFLMENLPKLLDNYGSDLNDTFKDYRLKNVIGSVSLWGNSQITRIRLVVIGIHKDLPKEVDEAFDISNINLKDKLKTSGELIAGLDEVNPNVCHVREPEDYEVHMWYKGEPKVSTKKARRIWLGEYKHLKKWPANHGNLNNQPGVYRNFANDYPLTVRKQNRQFNHMGYMLSPREMARIQGVPDSFKLWYNSEQHLYCINKGRTTVTKSPPYEIGLWFYQVLNYLQKQKQL